MRAKRKTTIERGNEGKSKEIIAKIKLRILKKSDNFTTSNREKSNITIVILEKIIIR